MPYDGQRDTRTDGSVWQWCERLKQWVQVQGPLINPTLKVEKVETKSGK